EQLEFFEKDEIDWKTYELAPYFKKLDAIREDNPALWGGEFGGPLTFLGENSANGILAFDRTKDENHIRVIMNCTGKSQDISSFIDADATYTSLMADAPFTENMLAANDFLILKMSK
ncbi:MAG: hypothetical protein NWR97_03995, partial [Salibacteraceae bacterium]|nr:hypothetical protein [Salibacteraceae bacterium]